MKRIKKAIACILSAVMLTAYIPAAECFAAGATEYTSAANMEFNKLYILKLFMKDEYTGEHGYTWYRFTPKTSADTKVEIIQTALTGYGVKCHLYDSLLQEVRQRDNKVDLKINNTYYLRLDAWNGSETEVSFMLKTSSNSGQSAGNVDDSMDPESMPSSGAADQDSGGGNENDSENDVDSDFWEGNPDDNNGSDVYDDELPVPEITEVENNSRTVSLTWSCDDADSIDGYYIYRSKDGKNWNKIATINDTEIEDYEDKDVTDGDACGYIVCSFSGEDKSENSVPEYTCFLKKVTVKSVKSNASKKLNVKWSTNPKSSGYQIRFSTTKSFTKTTTSSVTVNSKSESSKTISRLKGGKKYYVQIRTFRKYNGEVYYSGWSPTKSVKVKG